MSEQHVSIPPHPADGMVVHLDVGDGAQMTLIDPRSFRGGGLEWTLRYGNAEGVRFTAASVVETLDYLCSGNITQAEAVRRLRLMRAERRRIMREVRKAGLGIEGEDG